MDPQTLSAGYSFKFCSGCRRERPVDEFAVNKQRKMNKTCVRHIRKKSRELDNWNDFMLLLRDWKPVST